MHSYQINDNQATQFGKQQVIVGTIKPTAQQADFPKLSTFIARDLDTGAMSNIEILIIFCLLIQRNSNFAFLDVKLWLKEGDYEINLAIS